jgi:long-chain acyl-CoA synthetase
VADDIHNLADAVRRSAASKPEAAALMGTDDFVLTWRELDDSVDALAEGLRGLGVAAGARVAIALPNVPEFAVTLFGALRAGLVAVPINPGYTARELVHLLGDSGASVLVATADVIATVAGIRDQVPALTHTYVVGGPADGARPFDELSRAGASPAGVDETGDEDLAVLLYTSGTAGAPKGAMLSHRSLIANHRQVAGVDPPIVTPDDVVLLALPLFHAFGLNSGLGAVAWHGACGVLVERFEPVPALDLIARRKVTVVTGVPQMYAAWAGVDEPGQRLASVRLAVSGAASLERTVAQAFTDRTGLTIFEGYGLTETAPVLTTALASPVRKPGSIGRPIPAVEVRLVGGDGSVIAHIGPDGIAPEDIVDDFDDDAGGVPGTDPGEIVVRGANLFSGYWPDGSGGPDPDGWWGTGDVAYADADGDLFIVDRLGELIIVNGFNVYPHEVELVLAMHPAVAEAAVVGVADPHTGHTVKAFVVLRSEKSVGTAELGAHCERNLARFKCPTTYEFVTALSHSATGKVRKGVLREVS